MISSDKFYLSTGTMGFPRQPDADNIDENESALKKRVDQLDTSVTSILSTLGTALKFRRVLSNDDDMDTLTEAGIYSVQSIKPANFPNVTDAWGIVLVFSTPGFIDTQLIIIYYSGVMHLFSRSRGGSPVHWFDWSKCDFTALT